MSDIPVEPESRSDDSRDSYFRLRSLAWIAALVIVPLVVTTYGWFAKNREYDIRMVEIGLAILRGEKGDKETTVPARRWALTLVSKYSGVEIREPQFTEWLEKGKTPWADYSSYDSGWSAWGSSQNEKSSPKKLQKERPK